MAVITQAKLREHISTLGVSYPCDAGAVKEARREAARKYALALNKGDANATAKMATINAAADALLDVISGKLHVLKPSTSSSSSRPGSSGSRTSGSSGTRKSGTTYATRDPDASDAELLYSHNGAPLPARFVARDRTSVGTNYIMGPKGYMEVTIINFEQEMISQLKQKAKAYMQRHKGKVQYVEDLPSMFITEKLTFHGSSSRWGIIGKIHNSGDRIFIGVPTISYARQVRTPGLHLHQINYREMTCEAFPFSEGQHKRLRKRDTHRYTDTKSGVVQTFIFERTHTDYRQIVGRQLGLRNRPWVTAIATQNAIKSVKTLWRKHVASRFASMRGKKKTAS